MRTQRRKDRAGNPLKPGGPLPETKWAWTSILNYEETNFCLSHPVCRLLWWQPQQTRTNHLMKTQKPHLFQQPLYHTALGSPFSSQPFCFFPSLFKKVYLIFIFISLAPPRLGRGMWGLVPWSGMEPRPLVLGAQNQSLDQQGSSSQLSFMM